MALPPAQEVSFLVSECRFSWMAAYQKTGRSVLVRIRLIPDFPISPELLQTLQTRWRDGIVAKWNNRFGCGTETARMMFDVSWTSSIAHHDVHIGFGSGRTEMSRWFSNDDGNTAAHEFGHMLGMHDEYADNCPNRTHIGDGTVMEVVTGPVVKRFIDAVCAGGPSALPLAPAELLAMATIAAEHRDRPTRYTLWVGGGPPGKRLEYIVSMDEGTGRVAFRHLDELKKIDVRTSDTATPQALAQLRALMKSGALPGSDSLPAIVQPGTVVGILTVEAGGQTAHSRFLVDESELKTAPAQIMNAQPSALIDPVNLARRVLIDEASRL